MPFPDEYTNATDGRNGTDVTADLINNMERKLGIDGETDPDSMDQLVKRAADPGHTHTAYAPTAKGVTNGDSHDHLGGDGAQIDHGGLAGLTDDDHPQYVKHALATAVNDFLVASEAGVLVKKTLAETQAILQLPSFAAINDIGVPGAAGFGVGICPTDQLPPDMVPLANYEFPASPTYGNYVHPAGGIFCYVPAHYMIIGTGSNGFDVNVIDVKPLSAYVDTAAANAAGYFLPRCFIDGGVEQAGYFVHKYKVSEAALGTGYVNSSVQNGLPLSTAADHNPMGHLTASGGTNAYYKAIDCAHAIDGADGAVNAASNYFVTSRFIHANLWHLSIAHGQAATSTTWCAWYDGTGAKNYPKGCNNNALHDTDDATVAYVSDGYSNCGKTGSGTQFAKTTHNGQECGVADLNGLMFEISIGMTCVATTVAITGMSRENPCHITWAGHGLGNGDYVQISGITQADWVGAKDKIWAITLIDENTITIPFDSSAFGAAYDAGTDPGTITKGVFYAAKEATAMKSFTSGNSGATDHWGATGCAAMMDVFVPAFKTTGGGAFAQRFGSGANQVFSEAVNGVGYLLTGLGCPKDAGGIDTTGTNLYGKDYFYQYIRNELCALACGHWSYAADAGLGCLHWSYYRTYSYGYAGWRCACYPV